MMTRRRLIRWMGTGILLGRGLQRGGALRAQVPVRLSLGTGGRGGVFYPLGSAMAALVSRHLPGVEVTARLTGGSAENMRLLHAGEIDLALTLADVAWDAARGALAGLPARVSVRTLVATYSGYMHVVTLRELGILTVADLRGRRVSTGLPGSGTEIKGLRVLEAYGVVPAGFGEHHHLDYAEAARALREGKLDAFIWDAGLPGQAILDLAAAWGRAIRLIPNGEAVPAMVERYGPLYFAAAIPGGTYPGVDEDVSAAAGTNLLVAHARMEESLAYRITRLVLEQTSDLEAAHPAAREITPESAVRGSPVPFHPGALRHYREQGITVPER